MTYATVQSVVEAIVGPVDPDHLALESLDVIEIVERLERVSGRRVNPSDIRPENFDSVAAIAGIFTTS